MTVTWVKVYLDPGTVDKLDAERSDQSRGAWIAHLVRERLGDVKRERVSMPEPAQWPRLPDPNPVPPGTDLRTLRKGRFSTGQRMDFQAQLRLVAALRLHEAGKSFTEIAAELGFANASVARQAMAYGLKKYAEFEVREYAKIIIGEHLDDLERTQDVIDNPGYRYDVKGELVTDPDGKFLEDETVRLAGLTEKRKQLESLRRLLGTDAPKRSEAVLRADEELNSQIEDILAAFKARGAFRPVAALPGDDDIVEAEILLEKEEPDAGVDEE